MDEACGGNVLAVIDLQQRERADEPAQTDEAQMSVRDEGVLEVNFLYVDNVGVV